MTIYKSPKLKKKMMRKSKGYLRPKGKKKRYFRQNFLPKIVNKQIDTV